MIYVTVEIVRTLSVTAVIQRSLNVTAEIKGTIGTTFSGIKDDPINGNQTTLIDQTL